ncbi:UNVERIFIED_CONTAM: hypothetical protein HDU68_005389 [Siphonaria sp. JEL0065]|nr:hypothetical protein HDU68_005389 [Siphonaria sp. JEL0065]
MPNPLLMMMGLCAFAHVVSASGLAPRDSSVTTHIAQVQTRGLILSPGDGLEEYPEATFQAYGLDYDTIVVSNTTMLNTPLPLESVPNSVGLYSVIVLANAQMLAHFNNGSYLPTLYDWQWNQLYEYQKYYGVRVVAVNDIPTAPSVAGKVASHNSATSCDSASLSLTPASSTFTDPAGLKSTWSLIAGDDIDGGSCNFPATVVDSANVTPILNFVGSGVAAAVINFGQNREQLSLFLPCASWSIACTTVGNIWFHWGTRGLYTGIRRLYYTPQIDDVFLNTDGNNEVGLEVGFRVSNNDIQGLIDWMPDINSRLPAGSNITIEMAFNGNGIMEYLSNLPTDPGYFIDIDPDLTDTGLDWKKPVGTGQTLWNLSEVNTSWTKAALALDPLYNFFSASGNLTSVTSKFLWCSHTFTHEIFNNNTYSDVINELSFNFHLASIWGLDSQPFWSNRSMVTPGISGIFNADALQALHDFGIVGVVGDSSRSKTLNSIRPRYWPLFTTVDDNGFDGIVVVPRQSASIYFNSTNQEYNTILYNNIYGDASTFSDIMSREVKRNLRNLALLSWQPSMFHQANLRNADLPVVTAGSGTGKLGLMQQWVESVFGAWAQISNWPVLTVKQDDLTQKFVNRYIYENAGVSVVQIVGITSSGATAAGFNVTANTNCIAPVTLPSSITATDIGTLPAGATIEQIGVDSVTVWIPLTANAAPVSIWFGTLPVVPITTTTTTTITATDSPTSTTASTESQTSNSASEITSSASASDISTSSSSDSQTTSSASVDSQTSSSASEVPTSSASASDIPTSSSSDSQTTSSASVDSQTSSSASEVPTSSVSASDISTSSSSDSQTTSTASVDTQTSSSASEVPTSSASASDIPTSSSSDSQTTSSASVDTQTSSSASEVPTSSASASDIPTSSNSNSQTTSSASVDSQTSSSASEVPTSSASASDISTSSSSDSQTTSTASVDTQTSSSASDVATTRSASTNSLSVDSLSSSTISYSPTTVAAQSTSTTDSDAPSSSVSVNDQSTSSVSVDNQSASSSVSNTPTSTSGSTDIQSTSTTSDVPTSSALASVDAQSTSSFISGGSSTTDESQTTAAVSVGSQTTSVVQTVTTGASSSVTNSLSATQSTVTAESQSITAQGTSTSAIIQSTTSQVPATTTSQTTHDQVATSTEQAASQAVLSTTVGQQSATASNTISTGGSVASSTVNILTGTTTVSHTATSTPSCDVRLPASASNPCPTNTPPAEIDNIAHTITPVNTISSPFTGTFDVSSLQLPSTFGILDDTALTSSIIQISSTLTPGTPLAFNGVPLPSTGNSKLNAVVVGFTWAGYQCNGVPTTATYNNESSFTIQASVTVHRIQFAYILPQFISSEWYALLLDSDKTTLLITINTGTEVLGSVSVGVKDLSSKKKRDNTFTLLNGAAPLNTPTTSSSETCTGKAVVSTTTCTGQQATTTSAPASNISSISTTCTAEAAKTSSAPAPANNVPSVSTTCTAESASKSTTSTAAPANNVPSVSTTCTIKTTTTAAPANNAPSVSTTCTAEAAITSTTPAPANNVPSVSTISTAKSASTTANEAGNFSNTSYGAQAVTTAPVTSSNNNPAGNVPYVVPTPAGNTAPYVAPAANTASTQKSSPATYSQANPAVPAGNNPSNYAASQTNNNLLRSGSSTSVVARMSLLVVSALIALV